MAFGNPGPGPPDQTAAWIGGRRQPWTRHSTGSVTRGRPGRCGTSTGWQVGAQISGLGLTLTEARESRTPVWDSTSRVKFGGARARAEVRENSPPSHGRQLRLHGFRTSAGPVEEGSHLVQADTAQLDGVRSSDAQRVRAILPIEQGAFADLPDAVTLSGCTPSQRAQTGRGQRDSSTAVGLDAGRAAAPHIHLVPGGPPTKTLRGEGTWLPLLGPVGRPSCDRRDHGRSRRNRLRVRAGSRHTHRRRRAASGSGRRSLWSADLHWVAGVFGVTLLLEGAPGPLGVCGPGEHTSRANPAPLRVGSGSPTRQWSLLRSWLIPSRIESRGPGRSCAWWCATRAGGRDYREHQGVSGIGAERAKAVRSKCCPHSFRCTKRSNAASPTLSRDRVWDVHG